MHDTSTDSAPPAQAVRRRSRADNRKRYVGLLDYHQNRQLDRAFLISMRQKYVYCPVSKVANSSIKTFLFEAELRNAGFPKNAFSFSDGKMHNMLYSPLVLPYQLPSKTFRDIIFSDKYFRFLFVRNPVDRVLSCFLDRVQKAKSRPNRTVVEGLNVKDVSDVTFGHFVDFIATQDVAAMDPHWRPIYYESVFDKIEYHKVMRFEDMATELPELLKQLYPRFGDTLDIARNLSPSKTDAGARTKEFVTPEIRKTIEKVYAKDFETFGY